MDHNNLWEILQEMEIPDHLTCLMRNLYAGQEVQLELDMEQQTGSKSGKEYVKAVPNICWPQCMLQTYSETLNLWEILLF